MKKNNEIKSIQPGIRFRPSTYAKLKEVAKHNNMSLAAYIEYFALKEYEKIQEMRSKNEK